MAGAARRALGRIHTSLPERLRPRLESPTLFVPEFHVAEGDAEHLGTLRRAIHSRSRAHLDYTRADGARSQRAVRPLALFFWGRRWTLTAWCELREDFRHFRLDRIGELRVDARDRFEDEPGKTLDDFLRSMGHEE